MIENIKKTIDENVNETDNFIFYAYEGLIRFGGSFANALGFLFGCSDSENKKKIYIMWFNELIEHACLFVTWCEKNRPDLLNPGYEMYLIKKEVK